MASNHSIQDIKATLSHITPIISDSTSTASVSSHPDYRSYNPHCMYDIMPQYVWHHMNFIWHRIHSLWYHTTLWHHTHYIYVITPNISDITSTVAVSLLTVYWLYHTYSVCDIIPTICMTLYECYMTSHPLFMTSQDCIHDITSTPFMTSHALYMRSSTLYLWHHSHCIYDKIPTMFMTSYSLDMTSHMVYEWQYNHCIWHHIYCICVITPTWLVISQPMYVSNHTHCM